jgi:hypothetical protein
LRTHWMLADCMTKAVSREVLEYAVSKFFNWQITICHVLVWRGVSGCKPNVPGEISGRKFRHLHTFLIRKILAQISLICNSRLYIPNISTTQLQPFTSLQHLLQQEIHTHICVYCNISQIHSLSTLQTPVHLYSSFFLLSDHIPTDHPSL